MLHLYKLNKRDLPLAEAWQYVKERSHSNPEFQNIIEGMWVIKQEYEIQYDSVISATPMTEYPDENNMLDYCIENHRALSSYNIVYKEIGDLFTRFEDGFIPRKNEIFKSIRGGK